jgi:hypothetical protein
MTVAFDAIIAQIDRLTTAEQARLVELLAASEVSPWDG